MATTTDTRLDITEGDGWATLSGVGVEMADEIGRLRIGSVTPLNSGEWRVTNIRKVGAIRLHGTELRIHPKTSIQKLFYLLAKGRQWGEWFDPELGLTTTDNLYSAIAEVFGRWGERVLRGGVLKGYQETRAAEPFIRGRWLTTEQINRRFGMPLPAELVYDDFTVDIAENRLVRSAAIRLLATGGLPDSTRLRLHRIERQLADVTPLVRLARLPAVTYDRRNAHYRPLVSLAQLVLENQSLEHHSGAVSAGGYLLDLARVFEDYVEAEVTRHAAAFGGRIHSQYSSKLDLEGRVTIKPDLVWAVEGRVRAVFDAKYKVVHSDSYPNADVYQMLAYCIRHGLAEGHLIYADGDPLPRQISVLAGSDAYPAVRIYAHSVDLSGSPTSIEARMQSIVERALIGQSQPV